MSRRDEVLVSTDWVAAHADDPAYAWSRSTRTPPPTRAATSERDRVALGGRPALPPPRDLPGPGRDGRAAAPLRRRPGHHGPCSTGATTTGSPPTRTGCCATSGSTGEAHGRRPQEVGARGAASWSPDVPALGAGRTLARWAPVRRRATGPSATTCWPTSAARAGHGGRPQPGGVLRRDPRAAAPPAGAVTGGRAHPGGRERALGGRRPTRTARSRATTSSRPSTVRGRPARHGRHRRTAASASAPATRGSCSTSSSATTGAQLRRLVDRYGSLVGVPVERVGSARVTRPVRSRPAARALGEGAAGGEGWAYERKLDGFRAIVLRDGDAVEVWSRAGKPLDRYFPELAFPAGRYVLRRGDPDRGGRRRRGVRPAAAAHPPGGVADRAPAPRRSRPASPRSTCWSRTARPDGAALVGAAGPAGGDGRRRPGRDHDGSGARAGVAARRRKASSRSSVGAPYVPASAWAW